MEFKEFLIESVTSDLKKKHKGIEFFSIGIAPQADDKYYKQILVFYMSAKINKEASHSNHFKDAILYGIRAAEESSDLLGSFDEVFHVTSTFIVTIENGSATVLNCVKNTKKDLGSLSSFTEDNKNFIRTNIIDLFRGNMNLSDSNSVPEGAKALEKSKGYIKYSKGSKIGLYSKEGKEIIPFTEDLEIKWVTEKLIVTLLNSVYTLYDKEGNKIYSSKNHIYLFIDANLATVNEDDVNYFYGEKGLVSSIENKEGIFDFKFHGKSSIYSLGNDMSYGSAFFTFFEDLFQFQVDGKTIRKGIHISFKNSKYPSAFKKLILDNIFGEEINEI